MSQLRSRRLHLGADRRVWKRWLIERHDVEAFAKIEDRTEHYANRVPLTAEPLNLG